MPDNQGFPDVAERDIKKACETLLTLQGASTKVNGWYGHTENDDRASGMKTIRGPFGRWFCLSEGCDKDSEGNRQNVLAEPENDIQYAAFALNNAATIAKAHLKTEAKLKEVSQLEWPERNELNRQIGGLKYACEHAEEQLKMALETLDKIGGGEWSLPVAEAMGWARATAKKIRELRGDVM